MGTENKHPFACSTHIEEHLPRQAPKALSSCQAAPVPLVPDVSLLFDKKSENSGQRHSSIPTNHIETNGKQNKIWHDDSEPRTFKPTPIAPRPNESYAAWRARAIEPQLERKVVFGGNPIIKSSDIQSLTNNITVKPILNKKPEDLSYLPGQKRFASKLVSGNDSLAVSAVTSREYRNGNEHVLRRVNDNARVSANEENLGVQKTFRAFHCAPGNLNSQFLSQESRMPEFHPRGMQYGNERTPSNAQANHMDLVSPFPPNTHGNFNDKRAINRISNDEGATAENYSDDLVSPPPFLLQEQRHIQERICEKRAVKSPVNEFDESQHRCYSPRETGANKKRESLRDVFRIVQLQNEQIRSLQSQVERLLKKNSTESQISESKKLSRETVHAKLVEAGTQTIDTEKNVISVGVNTSFANLSMHDFTLQTNSTDLCPNSNVSNSVSVREEVKADRNSESNEKHQDVNKNARINSASCDINRKSEPRKAVSNMHQIVEETESDESQSGKITPKNNDYYVQNRPVNVGDSGVPFRNGADVVKDNDVGRCSPMQQCVNAPKTNANENRPNSSPHRGTNERLSNKTGDSEHNKHPLPKRKCKDDEMTMTLNGVEFQTVADPPLSPEPSIHVDIQDYHEFSKDDEGNSSDESSYSSDTESSSSTDDERHPQNGDELQKKVVAAGRISEKNGDNAVGWTYYDNMLVQVNKLLENQQVVAKPQSSPSRGHQNVRYIPQSPLANESAVPATVRSQPKNQNVSPQGNNTVPVLDAVRAATIKHLRKLGINYPTEEPKSSPAHEHGRAVWNAPVERYPSELSLQRNALAIKYLNDDQLAGFGLLNLKKECLNQQTEKYSEPQLAEGVLGGASSADLTTCGMNYTNMSFATLRYLQRYQLMPPYAGGMKFHQSETTQQENVFVTPSAQGADYGQYNPVTRENATTGSSNPGPQYRDTSFVRTEEVFSSKCFIIQRGGNGEDLPYVASNGDGNAHGVGVGAVPERRTHPNDGKKRHVKKSKSRPPKHRDDKIERHENQNADVLRKDERNKQKKSETPIDFGRKPQSSNILDITLLRQQPKLL